MTQNVIESKIYIKIINKKKNKIEMKIDFSDAQFNLNFKNLFGNYYKRCVV